MHENFKKQMFFYNFKMFYNKLRVDTMYFKNLPNNFSRFVSVKCLQFRLLTFLEIQLIKILNITLSIDSIYNELCK